MATATAPTTSIRHRIGIDAPQARVRDALATTDGVASWWTTDTTGDATEGGTIDLRFGDRGSIRIEVTRATPDRIDWRFVDGPPEWLVTTATFELTQEGDETVVMFHHDGWVEPVPFMAHCSTKWGSFLLGMKAGLEGGEAAPFPGDVHISSWD